MSEEKKDQGISRRDFMKTAGMAAAAGSVLTMGLPKDAHAAKTLKIGFMGPYTGPASRTGDQFKRGIEMALEDAKEAGDIPVKVDGNTLDIEPMWVDSQSSPEKAVKAVNDAVNRGVKLMVTGWHSSVAMACMDAESPLKIVHIGHQGESQYVNFKINDHPKNIRDGSRGGHLRRYSRDSTALRCCILWKKASGNQPTKRQPSSSRIPTSVADGAKRWWLA